MRRFAVDQVVRAEIAFALPLYLSSGDQDGREGHDQLPGGHAGPRKKETPAPLAHAVVEARGQWFLRDSTPAQSDRRPAAIHDPPVLPPIPQLETRVEALQMRQVVFRKGAATGCLGYGCSGLLQTPLVCPESIWILNASPGRLRYAQGVPRCAKAMFSRTRWAVR